MDKKIKDLLEAIKPIVVAIEANDTETLSLIADSSVIWTAENQYTGELHITIGDLRKIRRAFEAIAGPIN